MDQPWAPQPESFAPPPAAERPGVALSQQQLRVALGLIAAFVVLAGVVGFFIGRGVDAESPSEIAAQASRLPAAYETCTARDDGGTMRLEDEGKTIVVDTGSEYGSTAGMDCVLSELGTPDSILAQMGRTTAMMGVQDAEDDGIEYSWSYHPDNGVDLVITDNGRTD